MSAQRTIADAARLLELCDLISRTARVIIDQWAAEIPAESTNIASPALFNAQKTLLSASGLLTELVSDPSSRLLEVSSQYNEARALHIVAELRVPDVIARKESQQATIEELSEATGIEKRKLGRLMRCLCSIHIFQEVSPNMFANNTISAALVNNEPLRAYIIMFALDIYSASDFLPKTLLDAEKGPSYDVRKTAFQDTMGTTQTRWEWFEEQVAAGQLKDYPSGGYPGPWGPTLNDKIKDKAPDELVTRPEHANFCLAMFAGGLVFGGAHLYDYPWKSLGKAQIVDVGGGVGGFCIQLSRLYPELNFVVQDRAPALKQAQSSVWPKENPQALAEGRVSFMTHDFFHENPVKGADVYWLRYIMHDWSDDYCVQILSAIRESMGPRSRILICDQVMNTTVGCKEIESAPKPLPANYGYFTRYSHQRDVAMMALINGIERTPEEFKDIAGRAGLVLRKIYDCRSQVGLVECVLPGSPLLNEGL
ncbi:sterigmatocystin 8-O-methyltransferase [Aspergillus udagawae]|uniref:Sterigmatocystin 8-O-methyltransferase n=1 Tax=Aspergillus udagawae TaxID=91492 RepID=A0ABQ1B3J2_9EURO|nr:sterigmatocystin 8-O-methyltransferase [Aspergillus udagawae]GFF93096.1 sterigmatocystin 8-O-methyltransferase [Aspergillus udagawae]GFG09336.1 sterigmatocystin 8-O-methyltransferase [Aspergillus udagawae]